MASNLYINEYDKLGIVGPNQTVVQAPYAIPIATQQVSIGGTSTASSAFNAATVLVMLHASAACSLAWGTAPTAVATAEMMGAGETRFYVVPKTGTYKVAVITNTDT